MPRLRKKSPKIAKRRASKASKASAVTGLPTTLRKPDGDLAMMLQQMQEAELQAQVQAETATKLRLRIVQMLRARRLAGNITVETVAAAIGRHAVSLTRVERGTTVARDSTLTKLLAFFGFDWISTPKFFTSSPNGPKHRQE